MRSTVTTVPTAESATHTDTNTRAGFNARSAKVCNEKSTFLMETLSFSVGIFTLKNSLLVVVL